MPKTNADYWGQKIARNVARDKRALDALDAMGWRSLTIWECELADGEMVKQRLERALAANDCTRHDAAM